MDVRNGAFEGDYLTVTASVLSRLLLCSDHAQPQPQFFCLVFG